MPEYPDPKQSINYSKRDTNQHRRGVVGEFMAGSAIANLHHRLLLTSAVHLLRGTMNEP
jgi:hypothetical protein